MPVSANMPSLIAAALPFWVWATMGGTALSLIILCRALRRLRPAAVLARPNLFQDEQGTATIEFTLLLPFILIFGLLLAQVMWWAGGSLMVHYAAQAAARTAIVQIPKDYADSPANQYGAGDSKHQKIHLAAAMSVMPVAGPASAGSPIGSGGAGVSATQIVNGIRKHYSDHGYSAPPWVDEYISHHVQYAMSNTNVVVARVRVLINQQVEYTMLDGGGLNTFNPKDAVGVFVYHNLYLPIPFVRRILADEGPGGHDALYGAQEGKYKRMEAHYVLTLEGMLDRRPEEPSLPRRDP
jgi:Flp pilus assembly protein TadG